MDVRNKKSSFQNNHTTMMTEEERRLFDKLQKESDLLYKTLNTRRIKGFAISRINKYPESAHFIYELLQNADDAKATETVFYLYGDRLVFKHNGSKHLIKNNLRKDQMIMQMKK